MKKLFTLLTLALTATLGGVSAQTEIVWDFSNLEAVDFEQNKSYSFKADDQTTEMRYSAGGSDKIEGTAGSRYLRENGTTSASNSVMDIDGETVVGKNRLIRLFVTGRGKLTITCNSTKGKYRVYDGAADGTQLIESLEADVESSEISVKNLLWIETATKGYITKITWTASAPSIDPVITATDATIKVMSVEGATQDIAIEGENLEDGELTATLEPAIDGMNVALESCTITDGVISTKAILTYTPTANVSTNTTTLKLTAGSYTKEVTITYLAKVEYSQLEAISESTTWDFNTGVTGKAELTDQTVEYVYADIADFEDLTFTDEFNEKALAFKGQYAFRDNSNKYAQNGVLYFETEVPGIVKVTFSNTGSGENRYVRVNEKQGVNGANSTTKVTESFYVPVGKVSIDGGNPQALRIYQVEFTTLSDGDEVTVTDAGYATIVLDKAAYFEATEGVTAYAAKAGNNSVELTEVSAAPAGTPLVIKAAQGSYTLKTSEEIPAEISEDINDLKVGSVTGDGTTYYALGKDESGKVGFGVLASGVELPATKAYILASAFATSGSEARSFYGFGNDDTTGIKNIKVGPENNVYYDLQGHRILYPTKGLYIVNGKKVIIK